MDKIDVLKKVRFGYRVAEEEIENLKSYFVETDQWLRTLNGEVDIVYGPKGSGKSAIYSLLLTKDGDLFDKDIILISAENPSGTPVFKDIEQDPPTSENEFIGLWKLYLLTLSATILIDYDAKDKSSKEVVEYLRDSNLISSGTNLSKIFKSVFEFVKDSFRPSTVEGGITIDPNTCMPSGVIGKISFSEVKQKQIEAGIISINDLLSLTNSALKSLGYKVWILLDRLDIAFAQTSDLEENALRALFRVYLDMKSFTNMELKIFLRSDIWRRITAKGFREASHITKHVNITWDNNSILNLIIRRLLKNDIILNYYGINADKVLKSYDEQKKLFYMVFPEQIDVGKNKPSSLEWIIGRTCDGKGETAPREIIHLLNCARDNQLRKMEIGTEEPENDNLFIRSAIKNALLDVSKVRLDQTLYAEYPNLTQYIEKLKGEKTSHHLKSLSRIWKIKENKVVEIAEQLVEVGFFEVRGQKEYPYYWIPFLYRDALNLVQGTSEPILNNDKEE